MIKAQRGTKDILPNEVTRWQWVEGKIADICRSFGYRQIRVPVFESTELFERGVGDTSDVVQKEMYTFMDKGGRSITLRPEVTASAIRAFLEHHLYADAQPTKLYYIDSCYRYEKPQAGRLREFHQFGIECVGSHAPSADAEAISLAWTILSKLGARDLQVKINSIGCPQCRGEYNETLKTFFREKVDTLCETCQERLERNPMRILDCKSEVCQKVGEDAPKILYHQCDECKAHFEKVKNYLDTMKIPYEIDDTIVRGLDYYTKTVFEIKSEGLVVCGGGRYDGLVEELGGDPMPSVGFAIGLERLLMILEKQEVAFPEEEAPHIYFATIGETSDLFAQQLVFSLRNNGIFAEKDMMGRSLKAQMKYADKIGALYTVVLGEDEIQNGVCRLKNMQTGETREVSIDHLPKLLEEEK